MEIFILFFCSSLQVLTMVGLVVSVKVVVVVVFLLLLLVPLLLRLLLAPLRHLVFPSTRPRPRAPNDVRRPRR